jgi:hypothetical protein
MNKMVRLVYYSQAVRDMALSDLKDILTAARTNNGDANICGMLCYDNKYFVQVLEGDRESVNELFLHISEDERHSDVVIISYDYIEQTVFQDWKMGYASSSPIFTALLTKLQQTVFEPEKLTPKQTYALLRYMSEHQEEI